MRRPIAIFGAGGSGRETLQVVRDINSIRQEWTFVGFVADSDYRVDRALRGFSVIGGIEWLRANPAVEVVVAVGSPANRARIVNRIKAGARNSFATLIHPGAWIGNNVTIGEGTVICAGAILTTDIQVGAHVQVNLGVTVSHDAKINDYATLSPGVRLTGRVTIGSGAEIGTGAVAIPGCVIGEWSIVGAGAVVTRPVPSNTTAVGVPARVVKERRAGWQNV